MKPEVHTEITAEELAHAFEEPVPEVDLKQYGVEDWATLAIFWLMAFAVFLQFFTRYVLNDSFAWTEEIATYCLVAVVFLGAAMCVRLGRHIHVDLLFRYLPARVARALAIMIDAIRTAFLRLRGLSGVELHGDCRRRDHDHDHAAEELGLWLCLRRIHPDVYPISSGIYRQLAPRLLHSGETRSFRRSPDLTTSIIRCPEI